MALTALSSVFQPPPSQCSDKCEKRYQNLIVTKCCHVFCAACLELSIKSKNPACPSCRAPLKQKDVEDESSDFQLSFEKFTHYIRHDFSTLEEIAKIEKVVLKILSYQTLEKKEDKSDITCAVCFDVPIPLHLYYIIKDKEPSNAGRYMHETCLQSTVNDESIILDIEINDFVKVASKLRWPAKEPDPQPTESTSQKIKIYFLAIFLPMSIWALAINSRIYNNKNAALFVLSIPALVILQIFSLFKAVFKDKPSP